VAFGLKRSFLRAQVSWSYEAAVGVGAEAKGCIKNVIMYIPMVVLFTLNTAHLAFVSHYLNAQTITRIYIQAGEAAAAA
jgi:hypothetical protein